MGCVTVSDLKRLVKKKTAISLRDRGKKYTINKI